MILIAIINMFLCLQVYIYINIDMRYCYMLLFKLCLHRYLSNTYLFFVDSVLDSLCVCVCSIVFCEHP